MNDHAKSQFSFIMTKPRPNRDNLVTGKLEEFGPGPEFRSDEQEEEEGELETLESDVKQMAPKILEYRSTLPDQLKTTLASLLSVQRPVFPDTDFGSDCTPSGESNPDTGRWSKSGEVGSLTEDKNTAKKLLLLKDKISSNVAVLPTVVKRMKECISKIDKLDSSNGSIHPAFKRKKTS